MDNRFARVFLFILAGPIIWAAHFLFIYAVNGVACARPALIEDWLGLAASSWIIVAASLLALSAMVVVHLRLRLRTRMPLLEDAGFLPGLAAMLSLLSAVAIVWETLPIALAPACA
jgi:hypothetical protein